MRGKNERLSWRLKYVGICETAAAAVTIKNPVRTQKTLYSDGTFVFMQA